MDDLQSEKEQIEEMKAWWAEYGKYIIAGAVIAVLGIFGWNQYQGNKLEAQTAASDLFEELANHVSDGDLEDAQGVADQLASNYANTAYAAQSRLAMARLYMDKNRDQDAVDQLRAMMDIRGHGPLKHVGRVRLARILLYQDKPQDVIDLLDGQDNEAFAGLYAEARGDAYAALGQFAAARESYETAMTDGAGTVETALVQMKLIDLPEINEQADTAGDAMLDAVEELVEDAEAAAEDVVDDVEAAVDEVVDEVVEDEGGATE